MAAMWEWVGHPTLPSGRSRRPSAACGARPRDPFQLQSILAACLYSDLCASGGHGALCPWRKPGVPLPRSGKW